MVSNKKTWIRAQTQEQVGNLFEEAQATLVTDYMYMFTTEEEGLTYDAFKHRDTRKYIYIPKRGDGLRLTEECAN